MHVLGLHHVTIMVDDTDTAVRFYRDVLGLPLRDDRHDFHHPVGSHEDFDNISGAWLDAGHQQVHLAEGSMPSEGVSASRFWSGAAAKVSCFGSQLE
jgi:catechol 2,3-dioxygenase-like lactoylglutathione lyase family enzyme